MKKKKRTSIANLLLLGLEKFVEGGELILNSSQDLKNWMYEVYGDYPKPITKQALSQAIKRLREKGIIEQEKREEGNIVLRLTQKGKEIALLLKDDDLEWDGRWRLVIFGIPESKRLVRDTLRNKLKAWGFISWQRSVWVSKKNVTNPLRELVKEIGIEEWVIVLESDNVGF